MYFPGALLCLSLVVSLMPLSAEARIKRSHRAIAEFKHQHPCPATGTRKGSCKGYVIDHVKPLACGGIDAPDNMKWQTIAEGKAKDKWERKWCAG